VKLPQPNELRSNGVRRQALRHPKRPTWLLRATLALGFFALEPFNFRFNELGHELVLVSVIAFSGQADTQRPQERQASTFGVYATCMP
jgi:hypothetical protein